MTETASDLTLDEMRPLLAAEAAHHAAFDGWTQAALDAAAKAIGIDPAVAALAFPGGAVDMIDGWLAHVDTAMLAELPPEVITTLRIRERITRLVQARLDVVAADIEALRRALAILAMPQNLARAARLNWRAADAMWHAAGDTATDLNHYSKRALLGAVYASTVIAMLADDSARRVDTRAFLARRIDGIMQIEKLKGKLARTGSERLSLARFIGRLRYPAA